MKKSKAAPTLVFDRGRIRIALWLRWNPLHFKWGVKDIGGSYCVAAFGFGMFTYMRRTYSA